MVNHIRTIVLLCAAVTVLSAGTAYSDPAETRLVPHVAEYKVKISVLSGSMRTEVSGVGDTFMARSEISPTGFASILKNGSIVEQSEFAAVHGDIRPRHYESDDTLSKDETRMVFDFDRDSYAVTGKINGDDFVFPADGPVHDRVSIQYQLMENLRNGQQVTEYALLDGDEVKQISVSNIGEKRIKVPFGRFDAIGIRHQADNSSRVSTLWCVKELGYLPIVIEQHKDGKLRVRAVLTSYSPLVDEASENTLRKAANQLN